MRGNQSGQSAIDMDIVQPGEMILSQDLADTVRDWAANSNQAPTSSGDGGSFTINLNGAVSPSELKRWLQANYQAVGAGVRNFVRQGGNTTQFK